MLPVSPDSYQSAERHAKLEPEVRLFVILAL